jgi:hypothetical protein
VTVVRWQQTTKVGVEGGRDRVLRGDRRRRGGGDSEG